MIREYVEGHKFNGIRWAKHPLTHRKVCFVRGVIRCDNTEKSFAALGKNLAEAQKTFDTYLLEECNCDYGSDPGLCPIHRMEAAGD